MTGLDRQFLIWALGYAVAGIGLGIYMAVSNIHDQFVTHTHVLLVGFVTSLIYAVIYRLWLPAAPRALAMIQFILHQAGAIVMSVGLLLLYGRVLPDDRLAVFLRPAVAAVLLSVLLMLVMILRTPSTRLAEPARGTSGGEPVKSA